MREDAHAMLAKLTLELKPFLKVSKLPDDADGLGESAKLLGAFARRLRGAVGEIFGQEREDDFATQAGNSRVNIATALGRHIYTPKQAVVQEAKFYERYLDILSQLLGQSRVQVEE